MQLWEAVRSDPAERGEVARWQPAALATTRFAALLAVAWTGVHLLLAQQTTPGTVLASISLTAQLLWPFASFLSAGRRLSALAPRIEALGAALEERRQAAINPVE